MGKVRGVGVVVLGVLCVAALGQATAPVFLPAQVNVVVRGDGGKPVAGGTGRVRRWGGAVADEVVVKTDVEGNARVARRMPGEGRAWAETMTVESAGAFAQTRELMLFTGAQIEERFTL